MENRKLRVGFLSNSPLIKTGLARNVKALLPILYKTGKYEIFFLNQSMGDGEPNYQRYPWHNEGAMKNFDQNRFNQDPNFQRCVAYGNTSVEDWAVRNKLDAIVTWDDGWAYLPEYYFQKDWYQHIKSNILIDITADSEPILPLIKDWAKHCPNIHIWSGFGERVLKTEDASVYGHVKTLRGAIDIEQFKPIPKQERLDLRHKFNIKDDEKIIMYLSRNQLRKNAFHGNQEALSIWKKKYPDRKMRLLFHTKFNEPNGWPIDQIRQELGLNKEDILCTYFCRNCQEWNIESYIGEDLDCPACKSQRSRVTAGIDSTVTEGDLNKIYNICDASCSSFTSGGQEYNVVESLLSGLPSACPNYSCGEDFILSGLVKEIKGSYYREYNTSFKKFTPDINSIVEFFEYIWDLKDNDRQDLVDRARAWAIKEFDANNISKQIETFLDTRQPIDWGTYLNKKKEIKNVAGQVEDKQTDLEFVQHCYKVILNMDLPENESGVQHWLKFLSQPQDKRKLREELVNCFRRAAIEHNNKIQPQIPFESLLDKNHKCKVLIIMPESIGDIFLISSLFKSIRERYPRPDWGLYFATKKEYFELLDCNSDIDKLLEYNQQMDNLVAMEGQGTNKGYFDIVYPCHFGTQRLLNYMHNGVDKHDLQLKGDK